MDILSYLSELIQTRKSVGILGLGTVYKKKSPGRYDAETHSFVPPSYTLDFTAEVKEEILLADYISKKRNVSVDTANYYINEYSIAVQQQLNTHKEATLGSLGKLLKDGELLRFEPAEKLNYGFDFFGLPAVKAEQENPVQEIIIETPNVEEPDGVTETVPAQQKTPEIETPEAEYIEPVTESALAQDSAAEHTDKENDSLAKTEETAASAQSVTPDAATETVQPAEETTASTDVNKTVTTENESVAQEPVTPEVSPVTEPAQPIEEISADSKTSEPVNAAGIDPVKPVADTAVPVTPVSATPVTPAETTLQHSESPIKKDEQQLRAEIEALNFYRSQSPVSKPTVGESEEVIWHIKDTVPSVTTPPQPPVTEPGDVYHPEEEEVKKKSPYLAIFIVILILGLLVAGAYLLKPEWFNQFMGKPTALPKTEAPITAPVVATPAADSSATKDTLKTAAVPAAKPVVKDSAAKTAAVKPEDATVVYEIIGASMHDQKEADNFIAQMKKSGITAKVVTNMAGKRLKMSIATLKDEQSAKLELEKLSQKLKIPGIYIYRNKQ